MHLTTLTTLLRRVEETAALYDPDFLVTADNLHHLLYRVIDAEELNLPDTEPPTVGVGIEANEANYIFSDWSRSQLLTHLGAREKWFMSVSIEQQAEELNQRISALQRYRLRLTRLPDTPIRMVRGFVSREYADITNLEVMSALVEAHPHKGDAEVVRSRSEETDRALYIYTLLGSNYIELPGTDVRLRTGMVLKNSEVGYSALVLAPFLWREGRNSFAVSLKNAAYRRIHRGSVTDLKETFAKATEWVSGLWGDQAKAVASLGSIQYPDIDTCTEELEKALQRTAARKFFILRAKEKLKTIHVLGHYTAAHSFLAVLEAIEELSNTDQHHDHAALAGGLLVLLQP